MESDDHDLQFALQFLHTFAHRYLHSRQGLEANLCRHDQNSSTHCGTGVVMQKRMTFAVLLSALAVFAENGTPLSVSYMVTDWVLAMNEFQTEKSTIDAGAASHGGICGSGVVAQKNAALALIVQTFIGRSVTYVTDLAGNRYVLSKDSIAAELLKYKTAAHESLVTSACGTPVAADPLVVSNIDGLFNQGALQIAAIVPLPPIVVRDTVTLHDTVVKWDTVESCTPTQARAVPGLAKQGREVDDYNALGRNLRRLRHSGYEVSPH